MANEILGEVKINEDITEEEVKQEQENIQLKLFGNVEMNVNNTEAVKENIENNEAVQRGLDKETALKQIEKLQEGHTYKINNAGVMKFTGQYNNKGMPLFESVSENKGNTQEISLTNKFDDVTANYDLEPINFNGKKVKEKTIHLTMIIFIHNLKMSLLNNKKKLKLK